MSQLPYTTKSVSVSPLTPLLKIAFSQKKLSDDRSADGESEMWGLRSCDEAQRSNGGGDPKMAMREVRGIGEA